MCNNSIKHLAWDSEFFSKKIGRIDFYNQLNISELLNFAKRENYDLLYVFCPQDLLIEKPFLTKNQGKLADRKVLYSKERIVGQGCNDGKIKEYQSSELTFELENLAYVSGEFSRFKLDKNFAENDFYRMYKIWIEDSVKHQIADYVFVAKENEHIKGMVTLKVGEGVGHIGLLAVSPETQGKGYGKALVQCCEKELLAKGIHTLEVPTQLDNIQACKFYEKCGFKIKSATNIYHFWL